tara:strand:+ start:504 stop:629 length:126 start_codon:yes stop_codon:yes gene_type:complete
MADSVLVGFYLRVSFPSHCKPTTDRNFKLEILILFFFQPRA